MTRLEVLKTIGLVDGYSINEVVDTLEEVFGCPPGVGCPTDDIPCQECWCAWLDEQTKLEVTRE